MKITTGTNINSNSEANNNGLSKKCVKGMGFISVTLLLLFMFSDWFFVLGF